MNSGISTCLADISRKSLLTAAEASQLHPETDHDRSAPQTLTRRKRVDQSFTDSRQHN